MKFYAFLICRQFAVDDISIVILLVYQKLELKTLQ